MSCKILRRLQRFIDGELPATERQAVEAHLAACPECARAAARLAAVGRVLAASAAAGAPAGLVAHVMAAVRVRAAAGRPWWGRLFVPVMPFEVPFGLRVAGVAAGIVFALAGALAGLQLREEGERRAAAVPAPAAEEELLFAEPFAAVPADSPAAAILDLESEGEV